MEEKVVKPSAEARRRVLNWWLVSILIGIVLVALFHRYGHEIRIEGGRDLSAGPMRTMMYVMYVATLAMMGGAVVFYIQMRKLVHKIRESRRFPPPGVLVVRETKIREGDKALAMAGFLSVANVIITVLMFLIGISMFVALWLM